MTVKIHAFLVGLVLSAVCLFSGSSVWAGDDEDILSDSCRLDAEIGSDSKGEALEKKQGAEEKEEVWLLEALSGNDLLCGRLLFEWANAVYFVFDHFSSDDLGDDSWKLFFQGFDTSFGGAFQGILDLLRTSREGAVQEGVHTHSEAVVACLFQYLGRLLEEMPRTALNAQDTAREYLARPIPPRFPTYEERIAHFNAYPDERSVNRHPFFLFMNEGYWLMRGWANQYPALFEQRHDLFHLAHEGVNLEWIQQNQYYASGMAQGQLKELLDAIIRSVEELDLRDDFNGELDASTIGRLVTQLTAVFNRLVVEEGDAGEAQAVRLGLQVAILAEFIRGVEDFVPREVNAAQTPGGTAVVRVWGEDREAALGRVRQILNPDEVGLGGQGEDVGSINLAEYLEPLVVVEDDGDGWKPPHVVRPPTPARRMGEYPLRARRTDTRGGNEEDESYMAYLESLLEPSGDVGDEVEIIPGFEDTDEGIGSCSDDEDDSREREAVLIDFAPPPILVAPNPQRMNGVLPSIDPGALRASINMGGGCL